VKLVFIIKGFYSRNIPLQPWRYIHEIAHSLGILYDVDIITDADDRNNQQVYNYNLHQAHPISPASTDSLRMAIEKCRPDKLIWTITPNSIAYGGVFKKLNIPIYTIVNYPLYTFSEIVNANRTLSFLALKQYYRYQLTPNFLVARFLNLSLIRCVVTQSRRNQERLAKIGIDPAKIIQVPPGLDHEKWEYAAHENGTGRCIFAYLGSLNKLRGIDILLKAFAEVSSRHDHIELLILARGADEQAVNLIRNQTRCFGKKVTIHGGWLEQSELKRMICNCTAVVLPFILVPSEMPFTALEVSAMGIPVISSDLDGIPEMVGNRGLIVRPGRHTELAEAMMRLVNDPELRGTLRKNCLSLRDYPSWQSTAEKFKEAVSTR